MRYVIRETQERGRGDYVGVGGTWTRDRANARVFEYREDAASLLVRLVAKARIVRLLSLREAKARHASSMLRRTAAIVARCETVKEACDTILFEAAAAGTP